MRGYTQGREMVRGPSATTAWRLWGGLPGRADLWMVVLLRPATRAACPRE